DWWPGPYALGPAAPLTITRLMRRLDERLDGGPIVIADIGDSLFSSTELTTRGRTEFLSPAYYTSMGFSVPAALGAVHAQPDARVVVIVGDGAFQMTGMELSNLVRRKLPVIVIVLNNSGYGTERLLHPGEYKFNEIHAWNYHRLPEVLGGGTGYEVRSEADFDAALQAAWSDLSGPSLLHVHLDPEDCSPALERLAAMMSKTVTG
ncbi:MAG: alpha-keto acid decarboxylase family protein, partial [Planctomycetales bacterium]|nr:alpha-keto acid decarboxylase family protein [Planctomycetales bacterium]